MSTSPIPADEHVDVLICGAALAGCATARALALADPDQRRRILVIDRHHGVHPRFSGEFIHPRGAQILEDLGFYGPLRDAGALDVDGFVVFESPEGQRVDLPYADIPNQRPTGLSVHHKTLVRVMRSQLADLPQVELREGWTLEHLHRDPSGRFVAATLHGPDGPKIVSFDLMIGADGKGSTTRKLAGVPDGRETVGFTPGVEVYDAALPSPRSAHVFLGAWGPILAYPIMQDEDGRVRTRVTFDLPKELPGKGPKLAAYLRDAFIPHMPAPLGRQTLAAIEARDGKLEMAPTVNLPAPPAAFRGMVLVGDAAGCSHPITASGMVMGLRDAEMLGREAAVRRDAPAGEPWLDDMAVRNYRAEHDRYVPTRQALADAISEAFRGETEGARAIRRALFAYWNSGPEARRRSMALLSCVELRPRVFLAEYLKTARHAVETSLRPEHAGRVPMGDRVRRVAGAVDLARSKLGLVSAVMWANMRPTWMSRVGAAAP